MRKHILYLASGSSRRFGENKLLYKQNGRPLFLHGLLMLKALVDSRTDCSLTVVSRYKSIRETARELDISSVDSPDSEKGISYTIQAGIAALGQVPREDFLVFVVADQPNLTAGTIERLLEQAKEGTEGASLCYDGHPGNPTLFSASLIPDLMALEGDTGGRKVLKNHNCSYVEAISPAELEDIDTKQDLT